MNTVALFTALLKEKAKRSYFIQLDVLEQTTSLVKARLYISPNLFVQVYRNDQFDTTNLVLVHNNQRLYGRDQLDGIWHRHTANAPDEHDYSKAGRKIVTLAEFLDEVETVLAERDLP